LELFFALSVHAKSVGCVAVLVLQSALHKLQEPSEESEDDDDDDDDDDDSEFEDEEVPMLTIVWLNKRVCQWAFKVDLFVDFSNFSSLHPILDTLF